MSRTRIALALAASLLGACAKSPTASTRTREPVAAPGVPERTSDRGDRFVVLTPIGQIAPEEAPRVAPPPVLPSRTPHLPTPARIGD
jgi:hypothetical protein